MLVMEAERFGGPQVLTARQVPDPVAGPGQVVVRTSAADVLFVDTFIRAGRRLPVRQVRGPSSVPGAAVLLQRFRGPWYMPADPLIRRERLQASQNALKPRIQCAF